MRTVIQVLVLLGVAAFAHSETIVFNEEAERYAVEFVQIGDVGNPQDARMDPPQGSVDYIFYIAKYELPCDGRNAAIAADAISLQMCESQQPALFDRLESIEFVNWLNEISGFAPAYKIEQQPGGGRFLFSREPGDDGYDPSNPTRNANARYFFPTKDEFHKAAFYSPETETYNRWSTGNITPTDVGPEGGTDPNTVRFGGAFDLADITMAGGESAYGTVGMTGNAAEWEEPVVTEDIAFFYGREGWENFSVERLDAVNSRKILPGLPGIRLVTRTIPEPASWAMAIPVLLIPFVGRTRRSR